MQMTIESRLARGVLGALAAGAMLAGCDRGAAPADAAASAAAALVRQGDMIAVPPDSPLRRALQVAPASETTVLRPITVPGAVEADPSRLVKVVPPVAGRIVALHKHLGDAVRVGDALFTLDSADLSQATSDATKAGAALVLAERNLARERELNDAGITARKDLEQAQSDQAQAQSEAQRARARLAQLGSALGRGNGREFTLRSPIAGHVIDQPGAAGGYWNDATAPLMTVADLSTVWLGASVQEKDLAAVFVGQPAQIVLNAYPDEPVTGRVAYIGQVLDTDTRTVKVRVALDNAAGRLRPGMYASAALSGAAHQAITIPATALIQDGFETRVFVERSAWNFSARVVRVGARLGTQVEIESGLAAGERVVVHDAVLLND